MKSYMALFCLAVCLGSCEPVKKTSLEVVNHEPLINTYFEHFNHHAWEKMASMYADSAYFKDPSLGKGVMMQSRKDIIEKYAGLEQMFPDIQDEVKETYPSGNNYIIVEFISRGTAPDGSKFELPICTIFRIENGLITQDFTYYDNFEEPQEEPKP